MTEEQWQQIPTGKLLRRIPNTGVGVDRRRRLVLVGIVRQLWSDVPEEARQIIEVAEDFVDGFAGNTELNTAYEINRLWVRFEVLDGLQNNSQWLSAVAGNATFPGVPNISPGWNLASRRVVPLVVRDVFRPHFRPVAFDPNWRTATAVGLARTMYDARHFNAMPILADALQDAGCEDAALLGHCRDANGVHVRGCWVVDHVLGKS